MGTDAEIAPRSAVVLSRALGRNLPFIYPNYEYHMYTFQHYHRCSLQMSTEGIVSNVLLSLMLLLIPFSTVTIILFVIKPVPRVAVPLNMSKFTSVKLPWRKNQSNAMKTILRWISARHKVLVTITIRGIDR